MTGRIGRPPVAVAAAMNFLRKELAAGPRRAADLMRSAAAERFSLRTLRTARKRLGVQAIHRGGCWWCVLKSA